MKNILPIALFIFSFTSHSGTQSGALSGATVAAEMTGPQNGRATRVPVTELPTIVPIASNALRTVSVHSIVIPNADLQKALLSAQIGVNQPSDCLLQCRNQTPGPADHVQFGISFINFSNRTQVTPPKAVDCSCLVERLQGSLNDDEFETAKKQSRDQLNEKILKSVGKKFVNDFAGNIEDISFFMDQTKDAFTSQQKAESLLCNDVNAYTNKIKEVCDSRGITDQDFIKKRKDLFINAVENTGVAFDQKMSVLTNQVMGSVVTPKFDLRGLDVAKAEESFARRNYDSLRMELASRDPEAVYLENLIGRLLKAPAWNAKIQAAMTGNRTPVEAIIKVIEENKASANYFSGLGVGRENSLKYLKDRTTIENGLKFYMQVHPGIHIALKDRATFGRLSNDLLTTEGQTLSRAVNANSDILQPALEDRCNKMVADFANAVCLKDDLVLASVDPVDVQLLLKAENPLLANEIQLSDLVMCETKKAAVLSNVVLSNLAGGLNPGADYRQSDFVGNAQALRRAGSVAGNASSGITAVALVVSSNDEARTQMGQIIDQNESKRNGFRGPGVPSQRAYAEDVLNGRASRIGSRNMSREDARKYLDESRQYDQQKAVAKGSSNSSSTISNQVADAEASKPAEVVAPKIIPNVAPTISAPTPNYVSNAAAANSSNYSNNAREALKNYIADKDNVSEVNRAVSGLSDPAAVELNRLRSENEQLLKDTLQAETAKYEKMKADLAALTQKAPEVARNIASVEEGQNESSDDSEESSSGRLPRSPDTRLSALGQNVNNLSGAQSGSGSQSSNSAGAKISSSSSVSNAAANVDLSPKDVPAQTNGQSTDSGLIITSTNVRTAVIPQQELSQEVQRYIETANLNLSSIEEIKTKGIVFKYQVMENNKLVEKEVLVKYENLNLQARQAIDIKLARKNVSNQVSKLAVLKLLIATSAKR